MKNYRWFSLLLLTASSSYAMPRTDIICTTADHSMTFSLGVSRYTGDPYPNTLVSQTKPIAQQDFTQFKNDQGELFLKFYTAKSPNTPGPDRSGYKLRAQQMPDGSWAGAVNAFAIPNNPGPEQEQAGTARPITCKFGDA